MNLYLVSIHALPYILTGAVLVAIAYRTGGASGFNTKYRDLGVPLVVCLMLILTQEWHWTLILTFGLLFVSLTTYWKKKGEDAKWWNWLLTGLGYSLAFLPWYWHTGEWMLFGVRSAVMVVGITVWSVWIKNAVVEELGRGALLVLPFLIGA